MSCWQKGHHLHFIRWMKSLRKGWCIYSAPYFMTINFHFHNSCAHVWTQVLTVLSLRRLTCAQEKRGESRPLERPHVSPRTRDNSVEAGWIAPSAESSTTLHAIYPLWVVVHLKQNCCIPSDTTCQHRHEHAVSVHWHAEHFDSTECKTAGE